MLLFALGSLFSTAYGTSLMVVLSLLRPAMGRNAWFGCRHTNDRNRRYPAVGSSDLKGWNPLISAVRTVQSPEVEGT